MLLSRAISCFGGGVWPSFSGPARGLAFLALAAAFPAAAQSATTLSLKVEADTYVSSGEPAVNFGSKGAMMIAAPTASQNRTEEALMRYDTASIKSAFDAEYGVGNWTVSSVELQLYSNYSTAGVQPGNSSFNQIAAGNFEFQWLSDDSWNESTLTWNSFSSWMAGSTVTTSVLGAYSWAADGSPSQAWSLGLTSGLVNDIESGNELSLLGAPTADSTVGYLFNTLNNNPSYLYITAESLTAVPEPGMGALTLAGMGLCGLWTFRRNRR